MIVCLRVMLLLFFFLILARYSGVNFTTEVTARPLALTGTHYFLFLSLFPRVFSLDNKSLPTFTP